MVRQRSAKPSSWVRFPPSPPNAAYPRPVSVTEAVSTRGHTDLAERARASPPRRRHARLAHLRSAHLRRAIERLAQVADRRHRARSTTRWATARCSSATRIRRSSRPSASRSARGTHYGAAHPLEVEWAELITSLVPSAEKVRFTASGTEAVMLALRVARAATGRDRIVKLDDHFHGWSDVVSPYLDDDGATPDAAGSARGARRRSRRWCRPTIPPPLEAALAGRDVAAVILEPSGAHYGRLPLDPSFVARGSSRLHRDRHRARLRRGGHRVPRRPRWHAVGARDHARPQRPRQGDGRRAARRRGRRTRRPPRVVHHRRSPIPAPSTPTRSAPPPGSPPSGSSPTARRSAPPTPTPSASQREWTAALVAAGIPGEIRRHEQHPPHQARPIPRRRPGSPTRCARKASISLNTSAFCSSVHTDRRPRAVGRGVRPRDRRRVDPRLSARAPQPTESR